VGTDSRELELSRTENATLHVELARARRAERKLRVAHEVSQLLNAASDWDAGVAGTLRTIATRLELPFCALWLTEPDEQRLFLAHDFAAADEPPLAEFARVARSLRFARGVDLPGRVWEEKRLVWLESLPASFARLSAARAAGLRAALAMPVCAAGEFFGVLEWFYREKTAPEQSLVATLELLGLDLGAFFHRMREADRLRSRDAQLRLAFEGSQGLAFEWDVARDRVVRIASGEPALPEGSHERLEDVERVIHPDDRAAFRENVRKALESADGRCAWAAC
jgi:GAF domain-containing protein